MALLSVQPPTLAYRFPIPDSDDMYHALADAIRDAEASGSTLAQVALETEARRSGTSCRGDSRRARRALTVMRGAVERGLTGDLEVRVGTCRRRRREAG